MNEAKNPRPFLSVLADAHLHRLTGIVRVTRGEGRIALAVAEGRVVALHSEGLPGAPTSEEDRELAALLAEAFAEGEPSVSRAAARQTLLEALRAPDAQGFFAEGTAESADPPLDLGTDELLREAAHSSDFAAVEAALGDLDRPLTAVVDPRGLPQVALTPGEGFLLSRLDGALTAREVLELLPMAAEEARRSLFGLLVTGLVRFAPEGAPSAPAAASAAEPAPPPEEAREKALRERREYILETHARVVGQRNHFEVLGLGREATEAEVKAAYFRFVKQFHPDTVSELPEMREKVEAVFARLGAAFDVLGHPKTRAGYEASLPKPPAAEGRFRPPPPSVPGAPLPPAARHEASPEDLAWMAQESLKRAEEALGEERYFDVVNLLEAQVGALPGRARHRGRLVLARAYLHNPKWLHRGEELLRAVVREDPENADA
jgi:hypothetical protein